MARSTLAQRVIKDVVVLLTVLASVTTARDTVGSGPIRTVALSGQRALGPQGLEEFTLAFSRFRILNESNLGGPLINNRGQVAFVASSVKVGDGGSRRDGIWTDTNGQLSFISGTGETLPNLDPNVRFQFVSGNDIAFNDRGEVAFHAVTTDASSPPQVGSGIWAGTRESLRTVVTNSQTPSENATQIEFLTFSAPSLSNNGHVAFSAQVGLPGTGPIDSRLATGVWSDILGIGEPIALSGQSLPTPAGPGTVVTIFPGPAMDDADDVSFSVGVILDNGFDTAGEWQARGRQLSALLGPGQTILNHGEPVVIEWVYRRVAANFAGGYVFDAYTRDKNMLVVSHKGDNRIVAVKGDSAPGTADDRVFGDFFGTSASINPAGRVVFAGGLFHTDYHINSGIWTDVAGTLEMVVRAGDHAKGLDGDVVFAGFGRPFINAAGQIAFAANLSGTDVNESNDLSIWAQDADGVLQLVAREGDQLAVAENDSRTIDQLAFGTSEATGSRQYFNDVGQLAFAAMFTDGTTGVFLSNRVTTPEPSYFAAIVLVLIEYMFGRANRGRDLLNS